MSGYHCLDESTPKAQKNHSCIWCGHVILRGSRYVRERSIYDGHHQYFAWHEACRADALDGWEAGHDEEFSAGGNAMPFFALYELERASLTAEARRS